jgi:hypothetical protein
MYDQYEKVSRRGHREIGSMIKGRRRAKCGNKLFLREPRALRNFLNEEIV